MLLQNLRLTEVLEVPAPIKVDWLVLNNQLELASSTSLLEHIKRLFAAGHKVTHLVDDKGFNLLHHAVLKGVPGKVAFLIETCK